MLLFMFKINIIQKKFHNFLKVDEYASEVQKIHKDIGNYILDQVNSYGNEIIYEDKK